MPTSAAFATFEHFVTSTTASRSPTRRATGSRRHQCREFRCPTSCRRTFERLKGRLSDVLASSSERQRGGGTVLQNLGGVPEICLVCGELSVTRSGLIICSMFGRLHEWKFGQNYKKNSTVDFPNPIHFNPQKWPKILNFDKSGHTICDQ